MSQTMTKSSLSPGRKHLVELAQETNHGDIGPFPLLNGEPKFDQQPSVLRIFLIGKDNGPNPSRSKDDFVLKEEWVELFAIFDRERSFLVQKLVINSGLPVRMVIKKAGPV